MKKYIKYPLLFFVTFLQMACDDNREQYFDDFKTILYFRNSGEIECPVYKPDETTIYSFSVVKAGTDLKAKASIDLAIMSEEELAEYGNANKIDYKLLPNDCYELATGTLAFSSSETYKKQDVALKTDIIDEKLSGNEESTYVLPLCLKNASDSINSEKQYMFIKPEVITPLVGFDKDNYVMGAFDKSVSEINFELPVSLSVDNKWTFDCTTSVDESVLEDYNQEQGTNYLLLPEASYTISNGGVINMNPDGGVLPLSVRREGLNYGNYAIPIKLTGTSLGTVGVNPDNNSSILSVSYVPESSSLQEVALSENMISEYPDWTTTGWRDGEIRHLYDGDLDTYYHSNWDCGLPLPHYFEIALQDKCSSLYRLH